MVHDWDIADIRERLLATVDGLDRMILANTFDEWVEDWEDSYSDSSVDEFLDDRTKALQTEKVALQEKLQESEIERQDFQRDAARRIRELEAQLKAAPKQEDDPKEGGGPNEHLKAVLQFYADPDTYNGFYSQGAAGKLAEDYSKVGRDSCPGAAARAVLKEPLKKPDLPKRPVNLDDLPPF